MSRANALPSTLLKDARILVVDDEDLLAWSIDTELRGLGAEVMRAGSVREALERFPSFSPDLAITDLRLPDGNGLELLKKWRFEYPDLPVLLITAHGAIDSAVTALRLGAFDYLQKPFDMKDLVAAVRRAAEMAKLRQKVSRITAHEAAAAEVEIVGDTPAMHVLRDQLQRLARSKANTALILGESGTGKELAARAIHQWSDRSKQPFVEINCASIPETLLESELFGYEKGAFTDARERKLGLFEVARGGSIFLDELGEMPLKLQAKLLRVLEYRRFKRLGGTKDIEFTGRIIAATNRNLLSEVAAGRFRGDLYYRLSALPVALPSLRERLADVGPLTTFFLGRLAEELGIAVPTLSQSALNVLCAHPWPGNVRELKNVLQRALVFHEPRILEAHHLSLDEVHGIAQAPAPAWPLPLSTPLATAPVGRAAATAPAPVPPMTPAAEAPPAPAAPAASTTADMPAAPAALRPVPTAPPQARPATNFAGNFCLPAQGLNLEDLEKSLLVQALDRARKNQTRAAQLLGISRHTLRYRLEKHGLVEEVAM
jgi:DNA-binding NtrC family response regulator